MSRSLHHAAFLTLILLAILTRAVIPAGFMPQFEGGKVAITICHGADIKTIFVDMDEPAQGKPQAPSKDCPYAPIAQSDKPMGQVVIGTAQHIEYTEIVYAQAHGTISGHRDYSASQPRAPPIIL